MKGDNGEIKYVGAFLVIALGLIVIAVLAMMMPVTANAWKPSDVTTLIGSLTTFLGSVVGAFLGVQVGAAGKDKAETARAKAEVDKDKAHGMAMRALAALPPSDAQRVMAHE